MPTYTFDPSEDSATPEQQAAEAAALQQGEALLQAEAEDKARVFDNIDAEQQDIALIGGKFKSQEELLKAYEELQRKMSSDAPEEAEEASEEVVETTEEVEEETPFVAPEALTRATEMFDRDGALSEESIEELSKMDTRELIEAYTQFYAQSLSEAQVQSIAADQQAAIKQIAGGEEGYANLMGWASTNIDPTEIDAFNEVANSGNAAALRFAVEALNARYKAAEGYEAPLVTGRAPAAKAKAYRSNAELARDIADPRYSTDPAFRADVEEKLAASKDLL